MKAVVVRRGNRALVAEVRQRIGYVASRAPDGSYRVRVLRAAAKS
jgi:hypothetical protein